MKPEFCCPACGHEFTHFDEHIELFQGGRIVGIGCAKCSTKVEKIGSVCRIASEASE